MNGIGRHRVCDVYNYRVGNGKADRRALHIRQILHDLLRSAVFGAEKNILLKLHIAESLDLFAVIIDIAAYLDLLGLEKHGQAQHDADDDDDHKNARGDQYPFKPNLLGGQRLFVADDDLVFLLADLLCALFGALFFAVFVDIITVLKIPGLQIAQLFLAFAAEFFLAADILVIRRLAGVDCLLDLADRTLLFLLVGGLVLLFLLFMELLCLLCRFPALLCKLFFVLGIPQTSSLFLLQN